MNKSRNNVMRSLPDFQNTSYEKTNRDNDSSDNERELVVAQVLSDSENDTGDISSRILSANCPAVFYDSDTDDYLITQTMSDRGAGK